MTSWSNTIGNTYDIPTVQKPKNFRSYDKHGINCQNTINQRHFITNLRNILNTWFGPTCRRNVYINI